MVENLAKPKVPDLLTREARIIREEVLDWTLLSVFLGEREGTPEEKKNLLEITTRLKDQIYAEAVYLLTHTDIKDPDEAKKIFEDIIHHRNTMVHALKRFVSVEVAALDYMQNVRNILKKPTIIEADQYKEFAYHAILDETTQTFEKELLWVDIDAEIEKAHRFGQVFSLLFIDLDNLKKINDSYGHEIGTKAIQFICNSVRSNLRKYDSIYRYGGDEFVVLLPGADSTIACNTARRVLDYINNSNPDTIPVKPGVSIGISTYGKATLNTHEALITAADKALYEAKQSGRNTIRLYKGDTASSKTVLMTKELLKKAGIKNERIVIKGLPVAPGLGIGITFSYDSIQNRKTEGRELRENELNNEMCRVLNALDQVKNNLDKIGETLEKNIGLKHSEIFDVYATILDDVDLLAQLERELRNNKMDGENVIRTVFKELEQRFKNSGSSILSDRSLDIKDIGHRILKVLTGAKENGLTLPQSSVVIAHRLYPADTINFSKFKPVAIITKEGGLNCHSAQFARSINVPSISKISMLLCDIPVGVKAIVNAEAGELIINPSNDEILKIGKTA